MSSAIHDIAASTGRTGLVALLLLAPIGAAAQASSAPDECFGFAFGPFTPSLDYAAAGHPGRATAMSGSHPGVAGTGAASPAAAAMAPRESAVRIDDDPHDSLLILYPAWWPAGVAVRWSKASGDTLLGTAEAFVANGSARVPRSTIRGVRVPCTRR
jgi:hypothetical protein